jgi:hypothetical protein
MDTTLAQRILLLALLTASALLFCQRLGRILFRISQAKSEGDFRLSDFARRSWLFLWEVLCQAKVIQGRPLPGLAHAFLLWGFGAFLLAELDHLATPFGYSLINRQSSAGLFYFWFVFLFGLCCTVSIAGLAFRRYIVKPEWLDPISTETNLTLTIIFILMITLLPRWWISNFRAARIYTSCSPPPPSF